MKVLVVDNEEGFASSLAGHLQGRKISAESVYSGSQALSAVQHFKPDVMILDLQMPDMSGLEVLARVKDSDPAIEVILLTGNASFDAGIACMQLGAFDYIFKPVDLDELIALIGDAYQKKMREK
ncbi:response regulator [Desulfoprunum benzoelyticum]|uniref:DNA-binding NtrC family response regulator n=1 Tax=Desulfoprunum benzoelyticum TaxID=1506996 RepID=A0A840URL7_9BACT|nr:response regulator [Desulfoprunum benzoelyticum]MBB5348295.1 DNA-binding NtrC family response regulator [Desulfoprunum benzoelyticum]MBM9529514.1 response regulator [Desulfoprunum benzoelyticum]